LGRYEAALKANGIICGYILPETYHGFTTTDAAYDKLPKLAAAQTISARI
jgi:hypothetical protein